jgi:putative hydroxymethylpyrimidine transport system substrate-binding protein
MRTWMAGLMTATLALSLTACGGARQNAPEVKPAPAPAADAKPKELKKVSLVLDWYPNADQIPLFVALKEGYFKNEGIDLEVKMPAENPTDGIKLVGAGKETFAFYYQPDVLEARAEGIPIVSAANIIRQPLNVLMATEASGIKSPKDLEGKTVGYPSTTLSMEYVKTMVKAAGGDPAKVKFQDVGWDLIPAISSQQVPAIIGGYMNHEKLLLEKEGQKVKAFSLKDFGVPSYYELVLITGEDTLKKDPELVNAMVRALTKGFEKTKADPKGALETLIASSAKDAPLDKDVEGQSINILLPLMESSSAKFGSQSLEDWTKLADWMKAQGLLKADVKPAEAFVNLVK